MLVQVQCNHVESVEFTFVTIYLHTYVSNPITRVHCTHHGASMLQRNHELLGHDIDASSVVAIIPDQNDPLLRRARQHSFNIEYVRNMCLRPDVVYFVQRVNRCESCCTVLHGMSTGFGYTASQVVCEAELRLLSSLLNGVQSVAWLAYE